MIQKLVKVSLAAFIVAAIDYFSKVKLLEFMLEKHGFYEILPNFNLVSVWNYGVSFGMFQLSSGWGPYFLSALSLILVVVLFIWVIRSSSCFIQVNIALIIGGAIGNVMDRFKYGAVADFFDFHIYGYHWPAFNVADIAISCGACLIILNQLFFNTILASKDDS